MDIINKLIHDDETDFYIGAANIIKANLPEKISNYALLSHSIRYRIKGLTIKFIEDSIDELSLADDIELDFLSDG